MRIVYLLRAPALAFFAGLLSLCVLFAPNLSAQTDSPALWKVAGPKGKATLFGSFHLLPPDVGWRTPAMARALEEAGTIVFETDVGGANDEKTMQPLVAKYGLLPAGQSLRGILPEKTNAEFERIANELGLPPATLAPMRPWLAGLVLGVQFVIRQGYDPAKGVEQQVAAWAKQNGKALATLESIESQLKIFADLTREQEIDLLTVSLREIRETPGMLAEILAAYRKGDLAGLEKTLNAGFDGLPVLRKRVLGDRHRQWLPRIENMLADGGGSVIIVGAAHLVGPDGIVALLRAKGYKIEGP
jgi:hypothetical protein